MGYQVFGYFVFVLSVNECGKTRELHVLTNFLITREQKNPTNLFSAVMLGIILRCGSITDINFRRTELGKELGLLIRR